MVDLLAFALVKFSGSLHVFGLGSKYQQIDQEFGHRWGYPLPCKDIMDHVLMFGINQIKEPLASIDFSKQTPGKRNFKMSGDGRIYFSKRVAGIQSLNDHELEGNGNGGNNQILEDD